MAYMLYIHVYHIFLFIYFIYLLSFSLRQGEVKSVQYVYNMPGPFTLV